MIFRPQHLVNIYYHGTNPKIQVGRLLFKNRQIFFEYDAAFIHKGLELSPFKLPLQSGVVPSTDRTFDGLFGVFNDSLPDGWGRLLLDRKLRQFNIQPGTLSQLDRLCFVGNHGMGALSYAPENPGFFTVLNTNLDEIENEIQATLADSDQYIEDLLVLGGSSGGARPKVLLRIQDDDWLIKFRSSMDPHDISAIEYAYHLMAIEAGLDVPEARLFPSKQGIGFFGVKRFDRQENKRIHMHTLAGLLHADHREPALDYETIMKATLYLTRDMRQCEIQFRNAVFNVFAHNRDDHSKNFSFLMTESGTWAVSPAYDLTFSFGPAGEHATLIMGEGKNPRKEHLLKLATACGLKKEQALEIISQVTKAVQKWKIFVDQAGVSNTQAQHIQESLVRLRT